MNPTATQKKLNSFAASTWWKKPILFPFYSFLLTILTFTLSLFFLNILGYNNYTILRSDLFGQYIDFIQMFLRVLKGEENFWYSFSVYFGSGTVLTYAYYALNPFNLLYLIPGISISAMTTVIITLKLGVCAFTFHVFSIKVLKNNTFASIIFSMCYALGSYSVTMHYQIMWLDAIYLVPIIVWLIIRLIDTKKYIGLIFAFFYLFITNFYMGYMVGIFSAIVFLLYLFYRYPLSEKYHFKHYCSLFLRFAYAALLAIGLSAFILVPTALYLLANLAEDNAAFSALQPTLFDLINSMFIGEMQTLDTQVPLLYCGIPVLLLFPFYFITRQISKKEKIFFSIAIVFLVICMLFLPLYKFMHAFDYPNMYGFRFAYLLVFILVCIACRVYSFVDTIQRKQLFVYSGILVVFYSFMIQMQLAGLNEIIYSNSQNGLLINTLFIFLWLLILTKFFGRKISKTLICVLCILTTVVELSINSYLCIIKEEHPYISEPLYNQWYDSESQAINNILSSDDSFYRIHVNCDESYNSAALWGFNSVTTFSSSDNYPLRRALSGLGIATSNRYISDLGYTPITDMLFAVKYSVDITPIEKVSGNDIVPATISTNPQSLSIGYMVSPLISSYEPTDDPFYNQEILLALMCGKEYILFEEIPFDEIQTIKENADYSYASSYILFNHISDYYGSGQISFSVPHIDNKTFYICFIQDSPSAIDKSPRIIAKKFGVNEVAAMSYGAIAEGYDMNLYQTPCDSVILLFLADGLRDYACQNIYSYYYDNTQLEAAYQDLLPGNLQITSFSDNCITGTVTASAERPILFTSIPYDKNWHAYVDGVEVPTYQAVNDAFLSLVLSPGEHTVNFTYDANGSDIGLMLTTCSIALLLISILFSRTRKERLPKENTSAEN